MGTTCEAALKSEQRPGGVMEDSKQDDLEARPPADETTCWNRLLKSKVAVFCKRLARSRFAMFCDCLLTCLPFGILLTAANIATNEQLWLAVIGAGIFFLSGEAASKWKQRTGGVMEDSKQDDLEASPPADETTCWNRLLKSKVAVFCKRLARSRFAMFCYCLLAFLPVVQTLSHLLTAANIATNFATNEHPWWAGIALGILYLNHRFTSLFMFICPTPSVKNLLCLYTPLVWGFATNREKIPEEQAGPTLGRQLSRGMSLEKAGDEAQHLKKMAQNWFINLAHGARKVSGFIAEPVADCLDPLEHSSWCLVRVLYWLLFIPWTILLLLVAEIVLFPFACLAIIPITIASCSLSGTYLRAALGRDGSGATVTGGGSSDADIRKKKELFLMTVSIAEACFESFPKLVLLVREALEFHEAVDWVFIFTFSVSVFSTAKGMATFFGNWENRGEIWETIFDLQKHVEEFLGDNT